MTAKFRALPGSIATTLAVAVLLLSAVPAEAGRQWCRKDPAISVAGVTVKLEAAVYEEDQTKVTGAVKVLVYKPVGVPVKLLYTDAGFNGFGEIVQIKDDPKLKATSSGIPIRVEATIPSKTAIPAALFVTVSEGKSGSIVGKANKALVAKGTVYPDDDDDDDDD